MPIMSDVVYGHWPEPPSEPEPYDVPRGTCPECGSRAVKHLVGGDLIHPETMETAPSWVEWTGCIRMPYTRECRRCGLTWTHDEDDDDDDDPWP